LEKLIRSPFFYGILYLVFIPIFATIYWLVPNINSAFEGGNLSLPQSIYFSSVTITTLGFGDIHPKKTESVAQLIVAFEAVLGIVTIGLFLNATATSSYNKRKRAFEERIIALLEWTTFYQLFVIQHGTLGRISQPEIRNTELSEDRIKECMNGVFYKSQIPSSINIVGPAIADNLINIRNNIDELLQHAEYLEPELIQIISVFNNNHPLERWLREYNSAPLVTNFGTIDYQSRDISCYSKQFHEIHTTSLALRKYRETKFSHHPDVINSMLENAVSHQRDYTRALTLAKRLYKHKNHAENAYFLTIVACLGLEKYPQARSALDKYTLINSQNKDFVVGQIKRLYKHISSDVLQNLY